MLTILVVDDDQDQRETLAEALGDRHQVVGAPDAEAALALLIDQAARFDLVITDLRMPGRTGIELKRELDARGIRLPLVLMSSDDHVSQLAVDEGFYDCLAKPLSFDLLEAVVARVSEERARAVSADELLAVSPPDHRSGDRAGTSSASDDGDPES